MLESPATKYALDCSRQEGYFVRLFFVVLHYYKTIQQRNFYSMQLLFVELNFFPTFSQIQFKEESLLEVFQKEEIVFLAAESPNVLKGQGTLFLCTTVLSQIVPWAFKSFVRS